MTDTLYAASRIRATKAEMEERAEFLIDYAEEHGPVTVRGLYYQAEVRRPPRHRQDRRLSYDKIQRQVLNLRRAGRLGYERHCRRNPMDAEAAIVRQRRGRSRRYRPALSPEPVDTMPRPTSRSGARRMLSLA